MGVEQAQTSEELNALCSTLSGAPKEALTLLGCSVPLERSLVLRSVFSLGAQMLFDLEEGRSS
jgi:dihydropteroate synthase